jgi:hypothetical protein
MGNSRGGDESVAPSRVYKPVFHHPPDPGFASIATIAIMFIFQ